MKASLCALLLLAGTFAYGQTPVYYSTASPLMLQPDPMTYGTSGETVVNMSSDALMPSMPSTVWAVGIFTKWVSSLGGCCLQAPLLLPEGAQVTAIGVDACDNSS